jgi:hypothetical protein
MTKIIMAAPGAELGHSALRGFGCQEIADWVLTKLLYVLSNVQF